jgi:hypothetical protein
VKIDYDSLSSPISAGFRATFTRRVALVLMRGDLDFRAGATGEGRACLSSLGKGECAPSSSANPKEHVDEVDPNSVLHANDALVALRIFRDVHLTEDAEKDKVEKPGEVVDGEEEPALDDHEDDGEDGAPGSNGDRVGPFRVDVLARLASFVEILRVETDDGNSQRYLDHPDDDAENDARSEGGSRSVLDALLLTAHRAEKPAAQHD